MRIGKITTGEDVSSRESAAKAPVCDIKCNVDAGDESSVLGDVAVRMIVGMYGSWSNKAGLVWAFSAQELDRAQSPVVVVFEPGSLAGRRVSNLLPWTLDSSLSARALWLLSH